MDSYFTIDQPSVAEFKDRGSRFLAHAYPITSTDDFKKHLLFLKKEHAKAVHHCFAWRTGIDANSFRVSDDGEPQGSAGRPILGQIDSKRLTNITIIVVRYFGGVLLGVPGLINAYKTAASLAIQVTPVIERSVEIPYILQCNYQLLNEVMTVLKQFNCTVIEQEMSLFCRIRFGIAKNRLEQVLSQLNNIYGVELKREAVRP